MSYERLQNHRVIWLRKPVLRKLYQSWFSLITHRLNPGKTLELGSGPGFFKEYAQTIIASDIVVTPWIDCVLDAAQLPFRAKSLANLVLIDVLHHLPQLRLFFQEALRVLEVGGKVIIIDVQITPWSYPVYRFLHQEPVRFREHPLNQPQSEHPRDPFDSNQAVTTLLFGRYFNEFQETFPGLQLVERKYFSFITYPLSGGFEHHGLVTERNFRFFEGFEKILTPLAKLLAFRNLIILRKTEDCTC